MLKTVPSYHYMQLQGKLINQTGENLVWPNSGRHFFFFFSKNLAPSVTRYHGQLSSSTISEKTNDPVLRKFSEGRTDRQTERQKDESDFIGRCSTNVERPKIKKNYKIKYPNIELGFSIYNTA